MLMLLSAELVSRKLRVREMQDRNLLQITISPLIETSNQRHGSRPFILQILKSLLLRSIRREISINIFLYVVLLCRILLKDNLIYLISRFIKNNCGLYNQNIINSRHSSQLTQIKIIKVANNCIRIVQVNTAIIEARPGS